MSFVSLEFYLFLPLFLLGLAALASHPRLYYLTLISYLFYAASHPPYLLILVSVTLLNHLGARLIHGTPPGGWRKTYLALTVAASLSFLVYYKYAYWVALYALKLLALLPVDLAWEAPHPTLPVGISFYTFQALSYSIDIYRGLIPRPVSLPRFAFFVAFFPQLVAGPIVRAIEFVPQIDGHVPLARPNVVRGAELVLGGLFKKCLMADLLALPAGRAFGAVDQLGSPAAWLAALYFTLQIYCDFSAYTDIARGLAYMAGFQFPHNFRYPYLATNIQDFWRRWHITLSFWFRDYVYISLGGNRVSRARWVGNILVTWGLAGLWHGAGFKFILWGLYHGVLLCLTRLKDLTPLGPWFQRAPRWLCVTATFVLVLEGWVLFRAASFHDAVAIYAGMFRPRLPWDAGLAFFADYWALPLVFGLVHFATHHWGYDPDERPLLARLPWLARVVVVALALAVLLVFSQEQQAFIYFAF